MIEIRVIFIQLIDILVRGFIGSTFMAEEFINCRNCGRAVPKTMYCIYCGSGLLVGEQLRNEAPEQSTEAIIPGE